MAWIKKLFAICLALVLVVAPCSLSWAGPGAPGGEGHPWDENDGTAPDGNPDGSTTSTGQGDHVGSSPAALSYRYLGSSWVGNALAYVWQEVANTRIIAKLKANGYWR